MDLSLVSRARSLGAVLGVCHGSSGEICVTTSDAVTVFDSNATPQMNRRCSWAPPEQDDHGDFMCAAVMANKFGSPSKIAAPTSSSIFVSQRHTSYAKSHSTLVAWSQEDVLLTEKRRTVLHAPAARILATVVESSSTLAASSPGTSAPGPGSRPRMKIKGARNAEPRKEANRMAHVVLVLHSTGDVSAFQASNLAPIATWSRVIPPLHSAPHGKVVLGELLLWSAVPAGPSSSPALSQHVAASAPVVDRRSGNGRASALLAQEENISESPAPGGSLGEGAGKGRHGGGGVTVLALSQGGGGGGGDDDKTGASLHILHLAFSSSPKARAGSKASARALPPLALDRVASHALPPPPFSARAAPSPSGSLMAFPTSAAFSHRTLALTWSFPPQAAEVAEKGLVGLLQCFSLPPSVFFFDEPPRQTLELPLTQPESGPCGRLGGSGLRVASSSLKAACVGPSHVAVADASGALRVFDTVHGVALGSLSLVSSPLRAGEEPGWPVLLEASLAVDAGESEAAVLASLTVVTAAPTTTTTTGPASSANGAKTPSSSTKSSARKKTKGGKSSTSGLGEEEEEAKSKSGGGGGSSAQQEVHTVSSVALSLGPSQSSSAGSHAPAPGTLAACFFAPPSLPPPPSSSSAPTAAALDSAPTVAVASTSAFGLLFPTNPFRPQKGPLVPAPPSGADGGLASSSSSSGNGSALVGAAVAAEATLAAAVWDACAARDGEAFTGAYLACLRHALQFSAAGESAGGASDTAGGSGVSAEKGKKRKRKLGSGVDDADDGAKGQLSSKKTKTPRGGRRRRRRGSSGWKVAGCAAVSEQLLVALVCGCARALSARELKSGGGARNGSSSSSSSSNNGGVNEGALSRTPFESALADLVLSRRVSGRTTFPTLNPTALGAGEEGDQGGEEEEEEVEEEERGERLVPLLLRLKSFRLVELALGHVVDLPEVDAVLALRTVLASLGDEDVVAAVSSAAAGSSSSSSSDAGAGVGDANEKNKESKKKRRKSAGPSGGGEEDGAGKVSSTSQQGALECRILAAERLLACAMGPPQPPALTATATTASGSSSSRSFLRRAVASLSARETTVLLLVLHKLLGRVVRGEAALGLAGDNEQALLTPPHGFGAGGWLADEMSTTSVELPGCASVCEWCAALLDAHFTTLVAASSHSPHLKVCLRSLSDVLGVELQRAEWCADVGQRVGAVMLESRRRTEAARRQAELMGAEQQQRQQHLQHGGGLDAERSGGLVEYSVEALFI